FSSPTSPNKEVVMNNDKDLEKEPWNAFSRHSPVNVSVDGIPCILFWAKRITIKFKNQTWLDLTDEAIGQKAIVGAGNSNCSEGSAMNFLLNTLANCYNTLWKFRILKIKFPKLVLKKRKDSRLCVNSKCEVSNYFCPSRKEIAYRLSLKFGDAENPRGIDISYNKLSIQSWFSLHRVEVIFNNSIPATFNATGIFALSSYSYHCQHVSSLQRYDALLLPSDTNDMSSLWEVTFVDFQLLYVFGEVLGTLNLENNRTILQLLFALQ
ncbi:hypothetical protein E2I00_001052, partial [Balaenoptera physalus]